ncbi:MAG: hypothetical protein WC495_01990 [Patescibacteria group bacterium]|jgi:2-phosphoglycerate kinase
MPLPLLIGGAPRSGKSRVAQQLAAEWGVPQISTDTLRKQFREQYEAERESYPWLYSTEGMTAEEFWSTRTPQKVMELEIEQGRELWPFLIQVIKSGDYGIIEGVSLLPELIWQTFGEHIRAVFLIDSNADRVGQIIQREGLWGDADTYSDKVKKRELEWVMLHNKWFRQQAKKYSYLLIDRNEQSDKDGLALIKSTLTR